MRENGVNLSYMKIDEIEIAVSGLSEKELDVFRIWFDGYAQDPRRKSPAVMQTNRALRPRGEPQSCEARSEPRLRHSRTDHFKQCYRRLSAAARTLVDRSFEQLNEDSEAPSLQIEKDGLIWSMNIGTSHKALALDANGRVLWYWVGSREDCYSARK
jgi:hypothetical protein